MQWPLHLERFTHMFSFAFALVAAVQSTSGSPHCHSYAVEDRTAQTIDIAIREIHDAACGGDPDVSPVVKRVRYHADTHVIETYDVANDVWR